MHVRIHVQMLHALRDSIVRLTLVKLTCPPSEEVNSLNGKECLSSTLWWHPLFPCVTLWGIITQVHSCLPGNWIWAIMMVEGLGGGWGEFTNSLWQSPRWLDRNVTGSERAQMSRAWHILRVSQAVFCLFVSYTQFHFKKWRKWREILIKHTHTWPQRICLENTKTHVLINTREQSWDELLVLTSWWEFGPQGWAAASAECICIKHVHMLSYAWLCGIHY